MSNEISNFLPAEDPIFRDEWDNGSLLKRLTEFDATYLETNPERLANIYYRVIASRLNNMHSKDTKEIIDRTYIKGFKDKVWMSTEKTKIFCSQSYRLLKAKGYTNLINPTKEASYQNFLKNQETPKSQEDAEEKAFEYCCQILSLLGNINNNDTNDYKGFAADIYIQAGENGVWPYNEHTNMHRTATFNSLEKNNCINLLYERKEAAYKRFVENENSIYNPTSSDSEPPQNSKELKRKCPPTPSRKKPLRIAALPVKINISLPSPVSQVIDPKMRAAVYYNMISMLAGGPDHIDGDIHEVRAKDIYMLALERDIWSPTERTEKLRVRALNLLGNFNPVGSR